MLVLLASSLNSGYTFPVAPKVLFVTALNSLQTSLVKNMEQLGIDCGVLTRENVDILLGSRIGVLFVGPEVLKQKIVTQEIMKHRSSFVCKVIDEAHLGKIMSVQSKFQEYMLREAFEKKPF